MRDTLVLTVLAGSMIALDGIVSSAPFAAEGLRVSRHHDVATVVELMATARPPLGRQVKLPEPGATELGDASDWLLFLRGGLGWAIAASDLEGDGPSVSVSLGVLRRVEMPVVDQVGVVTSAHFEPVAAGPALRAEALHALGLEIGALWYEEFGDFRAFAALDLSWSFLRDALE